MKERTRERKREYSIFEQDDHWGKETEGERKKSEQSIEKKRDRQEKRE